MADAPPKPLKTASSSSSMGVAVGALRSTTRRANNLLAGQLPVARTSKANEYGVYEPDLEVDPRSVEEYPPHGQFSYLDPVARDGGLYVRRLPETIYSALIMGHLVLENYEKRRRPKLPEAKTCCDQLRNCCTSLDYTIRDLCTYGRTFTFTDLPLILTWALAVAVQFTASDTPPHTHKSSTGRPAARASHGLGAAALNAATLALPRALARAARVLPARGGRRCRWRPHRRLQRHRRHSALPRPVCLCGLRYGRHARDVGDA